MLISAPQSHMVRVLPGPIWVKMNIWSKVWNFFESGFFGYWLRIREKKILVADIWPSNHEKKVFFQCFILHTPLNNFTFYCIGKSTKNYPSDKKIMLRKFLFEMKLGLENRKKWLKSGKISISRTCSTSSIFFEFWNINWNAHFWRYITATDYIKVLLDRPDLEDARA